MYTLLGASTYNTIHVFIQFMYWPSSKTSKLVINSSTPIHNKDQRLGEASVRSHELLGVPSAVKKVITARHRLTDIGHR